MPRPWAALIEILVSNPRRAKSVARSSCLGSSILLMTRTIGLRDLRNIRASSSSIGDRPCLASTSKSKSSLSLIAFSAVCRTWASNSDSPAPPTPPVSQTIKGREARLHTAEIRSRVMPGWSCTIAIFRPTSRLNKADLPTLGRPTIATFGVLLSSFMQQDVRC